MIHSVVAGRYARAMFAIGLERQIADQIEQELVVVKEALTSSDELSSWLNSFSVDVVDKKALLATVFAELSEFVQNLLFLLADRHRLNEATGIALSYQKLNNEHKGIAEAVIKSAFPLSEEDEKQLVETFEHITKKNIHVKKEVDSDLLGGVIVKIGDRVYDGSLQSKLNRFQESLKRSKV